MVDISFSLVRKAHGNLGADALERIDIIQLNNYGIEEIDNLEVFDQIRELHLSGNRIRRIENLEFLSKLEYLDLSNNKIDDEGLRAGIGKLPDSLQTLIIGGNSCCKNEDILIELNDLMPNLGIVVGVEKEESQRNENESNRDPALEEKKSEGKENTEDEEDEEDEDEINDKKYEDDLSLIRNGGVLNADDILKSIVERKCAIQNQAEKFINVDEVIKKLDIECKNALKDVGKKASTAKEKRLVRKMEKGDSESASYIFSTVDKLLREGEGDSSSSGSDEKENENDANKKIEGISSISKSANSSNPSELELDSAASRIDSFLESSRQRRQDSTDFVHNLRENVLKMRDERMAKAKGESKE